MSKGSSFSVDLDGKNASVAVHACFGALSVSAYIRLCIGLCVRQWFSENAGFLGCKGSMGESWVGGLLELTKAEKMNKMDVPCMQNTCTFVAVMFLCEKS